MYTYLFVGFISVLLSYLHPNKKQGLKLAMLLITLFLGLRYMWGNDYQAYLDWYYEFNSNTEFGLFDISQSKGLMRGNEYGWVLINRLFGYLHLGFFGLVLVLTVFECWVIYRMIHKYVSANYYWAAVFFWVFTASSFCVNASMMRQYLCMCLYLLVLDFMIEKKVKGYLFWSIGLILIGITIHRSCIFLLATIPLFYLKFNENNNSSKKWAALIGVLFVAWTIWGRNLIEPSIEAFLEDSEDYAQYLVYMGRENTGVLSSGLGSIFRYITLVLWLWLLPDFDKRKQPVVFLIVSSYFFEVVAGIAPVAGRLALYFSFLSLFCWTWLLEKAKDHKVLYFFLVGEVLIMVRSIPQFFNSPVWVERFSHYQTILSAPSWM